MFHWDANEHITKDAPKLGVKSKAATEVTLIDEHGEPFTYYYPRRKELNFASQKDIKDLQKWRRQIIKRKLDENNDGQSRKTQSLPHWSEEEKDFLKYKVLQAIKAKKSKLNDQDWIAVAREFNRRFNGSWIPGKSFSIHLAVFQGILLTLTTSTAGQGAPAYRVKGGGMRGGNLIATGHPLSNRSTKAIKIKAYAYPDILKGMEDALVEEGEEPDAGEAPSDGDEEEDE